MVSLKSVGEVPEEGASVRNPENGSEDLDDVRTRLDDILGVLSGRGRSSTRGGRGSGRQWRDPSIGGRSSEAGRRRSTSRTSEKKDEVPKSESEAPDACYSEAKTLRSALKHRCQSYEPQRRKSSGEAQ